jgi:ABC-2 type transport system ATP-binding protein
VGLASRAPLTLFDEPYLGLDAVARQRFYDHLLADVAEHPRTVLLSTHLIDEIADLLEHVVIIDHGRLMLQAEADELRREAVTVTGPVADVDEAVGAVPAATVLARERLGGVGRVTVRLHGASLDLPVGTPLHVEPLSLQRLVVHLTTPPTGPAPGQDPPAGGTSADQLLARAEGASR